MTRFISITGHYNLTTKPSWHKGKCATAVRVWRPLAKKSTANQRYAIFYSYWWLIVTVAVLRPFARSRIEVKNRQFCLVYSDCRP